MISGNIKALVPLFREKLHSEDTTAHPHLLKFQRGKLEPLREKRIFGVLTTRQVGYVPNVKVNFTVNEATFGQDTYAFKSLVQGPDQALAEVDLDDELYKEQVVNEYERNEIDEVDQCIKDICTVQQIQTFHRTLVRDLYRRELSVDFAKGVEHVEKRYFLVPLKLRKETGAEKGVLRYEVDKKLLEKVEQLSLRGYKDCQPNIVEWL